VIRHAAGAALALALAGCVPDEGPMMEPGSDCMECHGGGGEEEEDAPPWTVAGTIAGVRGAHITITDANGWSFTLRSNDAGNFYTAEPVAFPLVAISVDGEPMRDDLPSPHGSCNACHSGGVGGSGSGGD
jgi:hypothetical protein